MAVPNSPWHREPARRAAKPQLSRELIVKTALEILAADGIDAVSMRRVAQALETGPASLYAHVSNKDELDELMFDRILGDAPIPAPDPSRWAEQVKELLRAQLAAMLSHPGIAKVAWNTMVPIGPNALRHGEAMIALLRAGGLPLRQAVFAGDALATYTKAFAYEGSVWMSGDVDQQELAQRSEYLKSLPPNEFPNLLQMNGLFSGETAQERFEYALDLFLAGISGGKAAHDTVGE
ncbi:regulatory protein, tetR family [Amycolatopsis xylanica]|uniref:Regulatory protein, tetR family n=1 Tax=Amycolatopsis xylanica TaxID=589385 RepID=A0A1H3HCX9_9PSEU|nr:TetR/AcrR family transcriptional regulator [Amycolatopsis xylanica]SDY13317.1 regulatory protein, tetR family [Amycolatopsis xylanica]